MIKRIQNARLNRILSAKKYGKTRKARNSWRRKK